MRTNPDMNTNANENLDDEIIASLLQLAKSGRFKKAKPMLSEVIGMFPDVAISRIRDCLNRLAAMINPEEQQS